MVLGGISVYINKWYCSELKGHQQEQQLAKQLALGSEKKSFRANSEAIMFYLSWTHFMMCPSIYSARQSCNTKSESQNKKWKAIKCWQIICWHTFGLPQEPTEWGQEPLADGADQDWRADQTTGKLCLAQRQIVLEGKASPHFWDKFRLLRDWERKKKSWSAEETLWEAPEVHCEEDQSELYGIKCSLASHDRKLKYHRNTVMSVINICPEDRKRCLGDIMQ